MYNINFCGHVRKRFESDLHRAQREIRADTDRKRSDEVKRQAKREVKEIKDITL